MKIDLNYYFKTFDGQKVPKMDPGLDPKTGKPYTEIQHLTLKDVLEQVLLVLPQQSQISGSDKVRRYSLAFKIHEADGEIDLPVADLSMLKDLVGNHYPPLVVAQSWEILDPKGDENGKRKDNLKPKPN